MKKTTADVVVYLYGIVLIGIGIVAVFFHSKAIIGVITLIWMGVSLLRRKVFGAYAVLFLALVTGGIGFLFAGLAFYDLSQGVFKMEAFLTGFIFLIPSFLSFFLFTRREVAESFGLSKITILEKIDKKQLVAAGQFLLVSGLVVGLVLLVCYFIAMRLAH